MMHKERIGAWYAVPLFAAIAMAAAPALAANADASNPANSGVENMVPNQNGPVQTNARMHNHHGALNQSAANTSGTENMVPNQNGPVETDTRLNNHNGAPQPGHVRDAKQLLTAAVAEVNTMKKDPRLAKLLKKAKGVYLVPEFGRVGLVVGGRGGSGVMLAHKNGSWSNPAFFDFGAISLGAQAGASGGPVAFLLMSNKAVDHFRSGNVFSVNAGAGLSIVTYSANAQASAGKGDIIFWTNTSGAYIGATVSASDITWDHQNNNAYYGRKVNAAQVLNGRTAQKATALKEALPG
jgi:SH3 domain-containing YSC84-like protein 1